MMIKNFSSNSNQVNLKVLAISKLLIKRKEKKASLIDQTMKKKNENMKIKQISQIIMNIKKEREIFDKIA